MALPVIIQHILGIMQIAQCGFGLEYVLCEILLKTGKREQDLPGDSIYLPHRNLSNSLHEHEVMLVFPIEQITSDLLPGQIWNLMTDHQLPLLSGLVLTTGFTL